MGKTVEDAACGQWTKSEGDSKMSTPHHLELSIYIPILQTVLVFGHFVFFPSPGRPCLSH